MDNILCSGGAAGADVYWGDIAARHNHDIIHFSYDGHRSTAAENIIYRLNTQELSIADAEIKKANRTLKRRIPISKQWLYNLLRRNWYQVRDAESVYAVGTIGRGAIICDLFTVMHDTMQYIENCNVDVLNVNGGTAWAIVMFTNKKQDQNIYLYEQEKNKILFTNPTKYNCWIDIGYIFEGNNRYYSNEWTVPVPSGIYAGIGTRALDENGKSFIRSVYLGN